MACSSLFICLIGILWLLFLLVLFLFILLLFLFPSLFSVPMVIPIFPLLLIVSSFSSLLPVIIIASISSVSSFPLISSISSIVSPIIPPLLSSLLFDLTLLAFTIFGFLRHRSLCLLCRRSLLLRLLLQRSFQLLQIFEVILQNTLIDIQLPRLLQDFSLGHLRHCDVTNGLFSHEPIDKLVHANHGHLALHVAVPQLAVVREEWLQGLVDRQIPGSDPEIRAA
mmetsp:Transcript_18982/g.41793  ORF Transcript_18982/g.41793 Transcript_18982/m.41793 type:complete len:224 (-) Transcript_18982:338-1009(-)